MGDNAQKTRLRRRLAAVVQVVVAHEDRLVFAAGAGFQDLAQEQSVVALV
jgi:hypothetical protein